DRRLRHAGQDVQGHDRRDARVADQAAARARDRSRRVYRPCPPGARGGSGLQRRTGEPALRGRPGAALRAGQALSHGQDRRAGGHRRDGTTDPAAQSRPGRCRLIRPAPRAKLSPMCPRRAVPPIIFCGMLAAAELALQSLKTAAAPLAAQETGQATQLLRQSSVEFNKQNYGGALYLANQAKSVVGASRSGASGVRGPLRPGEVLFALPLRLETVNRSNVREGPGAGYAVAFTLETGAPVVGYSYADQWVHIGDEAGRSGWMFQTLVGRRQTR